MKTPAQPAHPVRGRTAAASKPHQPRNGETLPAQEGERKPRLPHEIDESAHSQRQPPSQPMKQAHDDLKKGRLDSGTAPVMDELYRREFKDKPAKPRP